MIYHSRGVGQRGDFAGKEPLLRLWGRRWCARRLSLLPLTSLSPHHGFQLLVQPVHSLSLSPPRVVRSAHARTAAASATPPFFRGAAAFLGEMSLLLCVFLAPLLQLSAGEGVWSGLVNSPTEDFDYHCPNGSVVVGLASLFR